MPFDSSLPLILRFVKLISIGECETCFVIIRTHPNTLLSTSKERSLSGRCLQSQSTRRSRRSSQTPSPPSPRQQASPQPHLPRTQLLPLTLPPSNPRSPTRTGESMTTLIIRSNSGTTHTHLHQFSFPSFQNGLSLASDGFSGKLPKINP